MTVTAYILFSVFGFLSVTNLFKYLTMGLNKTEVILLVFSVLLSAISAGLIWG